MLILPLIPSFLRPYMDKSSGKIVFLLSILFALIAISQKQNNLLGAVEYIDCFSVEG